MSLANYEIGTSDSNLVNIETLVTGTTKKLRPPKSFYEPFADYVDLVDASRKGVGWASAEWHWDYLTQAQRNALRVYCTGASSTVYIRTRGNDSSDQYVYLTGTMIWPEGDEDKTAGRRLDFTIRFRNLTSFSPP